MPGHPLNPCRPLPHYPHTFRRQMFIQKLQLPHESCRRRFGLSPCLCQKGVPGRQHLAVLDKMMHVLRVQLAQGHVQCPASQLRTVRHQSGVLRFHQHYLQVSQHVCGGHFHPVHEQVLGQSRAQSAGPEEHAQVMPAGRVLRFGPQIKVLRLLGVQAVMHRLPVGLRPQRLAQGQEADGVEQVGLAGSVGSLYQRAGCLKVQLHMPEVAELPQFHPLQNHGRRGLPLGIRGPTPAARFPARPGAPPGFPGQPRHGVWTSSSDPPPAACPPWLGPGPGRAAPRCAWSAVRHRV